MRLFNRNKNFVTTNPSDKPSKRFEKVLFHTLEKEGYRYLSSKSEFTQDFGYGKRIISLSYNGSFGYISSVQYFIKIIFKDLEKAFKKVYPDYGWTNWTILENLHWTDSWLCDKNTGEYSDKSINKLADEFFREIKPKIDLTFTEIRNYQALNKAYNSIPSDFFDYLPNSRLEKRIVNGLILTKNLEPVNYQETKNEYFKLLDKYKGNDMEGIRSKVEQGMIFLDQNELKINTTANNV